MIRRLLIFASENCTYVTGDHAARANEKLRKKRNKHTDWCIINCVAKERIWTQARRLGGGRMNQMIFQPKTTKHMQKSTYYVVVCMRIVNSIVMLGESICWIHVQLTVGWQARQRFSSCYVTKHRQSLHMVLSAPPQTLLKGKPTFSEEEALVFHDGCLSSRATSVRTRWLRLRDLLVMEQGRPTSWVRSLLFNNNNSKAAVCARTHIVLACKGPELPRRRGERCRCTGRRRCRRWSG